jgi:hypothetical protein
MGFVIEDSFLFWHPVKKNIRQRIVHARILILNKILFLKVYADLYRKSRLKKQRLDITHWLMELAHILEELAYDLGELPREAIEAAVAKRTQMTPYLIEILQDAINRIDEIIEDDNYQGHLYALYLLAQFREEKAYPYIIQLFSFPGEIPHAIAGDVLTEDLSRILASVCGKQIEPLLNLIENPTINEYVRAACQTALVTLVGCGILSRTEVVEYFRMLFEAKLEHVPSFAWDNLIACCCALYPEELLIHIKTAFEEELIDQAFISLEDVMTVMTEEKQALLFDLSQKTDLIDDTVSEMEKWLGTHA